MRILCRKCLEYTTQPAGNRNIPNRQRETGIYHRESNFCEEEPSFKVANRLQVTVTYTRQGQVIGANVAILEIMLHSVILYN